MILWKSNWFTWPEIHRIILLLLSICQNYWPDINPQLTSLSSLICRRAYIIKMTSSVIINKPHSPSVSFALNYNALLSVFLDTIFFWWTFCEYNLMISKMNHKDGITHASEIFKTSVIFHLQNRHITNLNL